MSDHIRDLSQQIIDLAGQIRDFNPPSAISASAGPEGVHARDLTLQAHLDVAGTTVLQPSDFTYLGSATLPLDTPGETRYGYSTGAIAGKRVGPDIHLYITGAEYATGWADSVYEVLWNGVGNRCSEVFRWGDVTLGGRVTQAGNSKQIHGLWIDPATDQLWWTYKDSYSNNDDPFIGTTELNPLGVVVHGPWRSAEGQAGHTAGYIIPLPARATTALGGGKNLAVGAQYSSIDAGATFGAFFCAFAQPSNGTAADTTSSGLGIASVKNLLYSDLSNPQTRPADADVCGWDHYGESNGSGHQPQFNTTQDGSGCTSDGDLCGATFGPVTTFSHIDSMGCATWIEGASKQGVVYFGQLARTLDGSLSEYGSYGRCHIWYGPSQNYGVLKLCPHGQNDTRYGNFSTGPGATTMASTMWIYDPQDLLDVAAGSKTAIAVASAPATDAYDMSRLIYSGGVPFPQVAPSMGIPSGSGYGGCWFDPVSKILFLSVVKGEYQGEYRPVIHAFAVNC